MVDTITVPVDMATCRVVDILRDRLAQFFVARPGTRSSAETEADAKPTAGLGWPRRRFSRPTTGTVTQSRADREWAMTVGGKMPRLVYARVSVV
jgi:hypothetical protein